MQLCKRVSICDSLVYLSSGVYQPQERNSVNNANRVYVDLLAIASMAAILLFGVFQIPLLPRYINLLLCMFLIAGIIDIASLKSRPAIQKLLS